VLVFCRERGLRSGEFFGWKKKLRYAGAAADMSSSAVLRKEAAKFVAVEAAPVGEIKPPVPVLHSTALEVRLSRGCSIVVEAGFDANHLRTLLSALEAEG
jgi:hypothetical protein